MNAIIVFAVLSLEAAANLTYAFVMRRVEEIEASEIANLTSAEVRQVVKWLAEYQAELWDEQIEADATVGRLDEFIEEALEEHRRGETRQLHEQPHQQAVHGML